MDYSARSYADYDRQQQQDRLAYNAPADPANPYQLDFSSDLYGMNYGNSKHPDMGSYAQQSPYGAHGHSDRHYQHDEYPSTMAPTSHAFPGHALSTFNDRMPYGADQYEQPPASSGQSISTDYNNSLPSSAGSAFRNGNGLPTFSDLSRFAPSASHNDHPLLGTPGEDPLSRVKLGTPVLSAPDDLHGYVRPHLEQYLRTTNRLAFGERTVIVLSSKVAQKSYGTEKRFICPPPTAILIGNSWWAEARNPGEEARLSPPRVVVSISGESAPAESGTDWTGASGKSFDASDPPGGTTYIGRCVGKQLYISDVDDKKKKVEALVKIAAPGPDDAPEKVIGIFPSRPIKVISKPSKKRQSAKNFELCINHGATIALFHRLRSQTVSTKYLCVSGSGSAFKGSDGASLMGLEQKARAATPSFIARTSSWDPFIMYIVDITKPAGSIESSPPAPPQADYPSPPPNAVSLSTSSSSNGAGMPIYYNQTVVLQCLTSGVVSPVLIIRKVDSQTMAVGGGLQPRAKGVPHLYCPPGEVCGDPVSQLHKIAFEVYDPNKGPDDAGTPGMTGAYLSCMGEKVNTYRPIEGRVWNAPANTTTAADHRTHSEGGSAPGSPAATDFPSNDGGRVSRKKGNAAEQSRPSRANRRRAGSAGSSGRNEDGPIAANGATWQVDVGETSVWTVVGTDQVRYNFYIPPALFDQPHPPLGSFPVPTKPLTPFPSVVKVLKPESASEDVKMKGHTFDGTKTPATKELTLYGENFDKSEPLNVYFGLEPSSHVEVRCTEVTTCLPPVDQSQHKKRPLLLVRGDGVVFPSSVVYP